MTRSAAFTYDPAGRIIAVTNSNGETEEKVYSVYNEVLHVIKSGCQTNSSTFDAHGNVTTLTDGNGT